LVEAIIENIERIEILSIAFAGTDSTLDERALSKLGQLRNLIEV
jgi:hypothetical protein